MKRLAFLISCLCAVALAHGQIDSQQILETQRAIANSGDSVGIWAVQDDRLVQLEPLNYSGSKVNVLGAALTYGIASTKIKHTYNGASSPVKLSAPAHFRVNFGIVPAAKATRYYMFSSAYTIRDFSVAKFDVKKKQRILTAGSVNIWSGTQMGAQNSEDVQMSYEKISDNVYDVTIAAPPGEYCFFFNVNGTGVYTSVFDFTIQ